MPTTRVSSSRTSLNGERSKPAVWFQPTKSLADARERILRPVALDSEGPHDSLQRDEVLFDLERTRRRSLVAVSAWATRLANRVPATPAAW